MRYLLRSLKYLVTLCVLYVALVFLMNLVEPSPLTLWQLLVAQLSSDRGLLMIVGFVVLAALYPMFGFMRSRIDDCDIVADRVRIDNAMRLFGFSIEQQYDDRLIYRAEGLLRRLVYIFEDRIELRKVDGGVELRGVRRAVARVAFQLKAYLNNRRYESDSNQ